MPLYEYLCDACGQRFELIQKFSDPPPDACPKCGKGPVERQLSSPAIQFKGSGWYITDYAKKNSTGAAASKAEGAAAGEKSSGDTASTSTTSDTASKTESAAPKTTSSS